MTQQFNVEILNNYLFLIRKEYYNNITLNNNINNSHKIIPTSFNLYKSPFVIEAWLSYKCKNCITIIEFGISSDSRFLPGWSNLPLTYASDFAHLNCNEISIREIIE